MSELNIIKKAELLYNTKIIVTELGANLMNIIFSNNPQYLIILHNGKFCSKYHEFLFNNIGNKINVIYIKGNIDENEFILNNNVNVKYSIDPQNIINVINKCV